MSSGDEEEEEECYADVKEEEEESADQVHHHQVGRVSWLVVHFAEISNVGIFVKRIPILLCNGKIPYRCTGTTICRQSFVITYLSY